MNYKVVITLKQKGFSKSLLFFSSLFDLTSAGSIFKVLMFVGSLEFCRQTNRQNDYSNHQLRLHGRGLIIIQVRWVRFRWVRFIRTGYDAIDGLRGTTYNAIDGPRG